MFEILIGRKKRSQVCILPDELPCSTEQNRAEEDLVYRVESFKKESQFHEKSLAKYAYGILSLLSKQREISQGAFFVAGTKDGRQILSFLAGFASPDPANSVDILEFGEGFPGQVAKDGKLINLSGIPEGYITIESGLGKSSSVSLIIFPVKYNDEILAVIELASFRIFSREDEVFFSEISGFMAEQMILLKTQN